MGLRIKSTKSKNSESFSIIDDYIHPETNKRSTYVIEALGSLTTLMEKYQTTDREVVIQHLKDYIEERKRINKEQNGKVMIEFSQNDLIKKNNTRLYNIGYLYIKNILCTLQLEEICQKLQEQYKVQISLFDILCDLVCVHIIFPYSKLSTFEQTKRFLERTTYQLKDIHCALHIFHENQHLFETTLYSNIAQKHMNFNVLYTDSSNFDNQTKAHNVINDKDIMTGYIFIDFVSNFVCSILKKNDSLEKYTVEEIISTLRHMNVVYLGGANYIPAFERTDLVDELMEAFGFQIARELLSQKYLNEFSKVVQSKKSTKIK